MARAHRGADPARYVRTPMVLKPRVSFVEVKRYDCKNKTGKATRINKQTQHPAQEDNLNMRITNY